LGEVINALRTHDAGQHQLPCPLEVEEKPVRFVEVAGLAQPHVDRYEQPAHVLRVALIKDVALFDGAPDGERKGIDPCPEQLRLQPLDPADRFEQMQSRSGDVLADIPNGQLIGEVDERLQAGESSCLQVRDRLAVAVGLVFDDGQRQRMLRAEVEIHCALGQFGLGKHVVKADLMVGKPRELACGGTQNLLAGGIRSGVGCLGHELVHLVMLRRDSLTTGP